MSYNKDGEEVTYESTTITLKIEGAEGVASEIEVLAWSWGVSNNLSSNTTTGVPSFSVGVHDLSITKYIDLSSPALASFIQSGNRIEKVTIESRNKFVTRVVLTDACILHLAVGGSGGETRLTENVTLSAASFDLQFEDKGGSDSATSGALKSWTKSDVKKSASKQRPVKKKKR